MSYSYFRSFEFQTVAADTGISRFRNKSAENFCMIQSGRGEGSLKFNFEGFLKNSSQFSLGAWNIFNTHAHDA